MLKQTSAVALLLTTFSIAVAMSPGCGGSSPRATGTAGAGGGTAGAGTAGEGTAGEGTAGSGTAGAGTAGAGTAGLGGTAGAGTAGAGTAGAGTAGAGTAGAGTAGAGTAGAAPPVVTAGPAVIEIDDVIVSLKSSGADGGVDAADGAVADGSVDGSSDGAVSSDGGDAATDAPVGPPSIGVSYTFDTTALGWKFSPYGSVSLGSSATDTNNPALISTLAWSGTDDADGHSNSGVLKGTVQYKYLGDRIDFQAFTNPMAQYNWTGFVATAKVKLVSGGNLAYGCPLEAVIYVSDADGSYNTKVSADVNLVQGSWVTITFDLADAAAQGLDIAKANQLGLQIDTGPACVGTTPPDAGTDVGSDGGTTETGGGDAALEAGGDSAGN